jgi:hypothetical protein
MIPAAVNQTDIKIEMSWASLPTNREGRSQKILHFNKKITQNFFKIQSYRYVKCLERLDIVSMACKAGGDTNLSGFDES